MVYHWFESAHTIQDQSMTLSLVASLMTKWKQTATCVPNENWAMMGSQNNEKQVNNMKLVVCCFEKWWESRTIYPFGLLWAGFVGNCVDTCPNTVVWQVYFRELEGYKNLQTLLIERHGGRPTRMLLFELLNMMVDGSFEIPNNMLILVLSHALFCHRLPSVFVPLPKW